jgi:P pilus assembly chaperone PapD
LRSRILALACLLSAAFAARATFVIDPAVLAFSADRGDKTAFIEVRHTGNDPAAIQFSVFERVIDLDGVLVTENMSKSSDFLVYPSELILQPGKRATVQIQYIGKGKIVADKTYVLRSQEVPLNVAKEEGGINLTVRMVTDYYTVIALETKKSWKLVFVSSKAIGDGKIEVIAENKGAGRVPIEKIGIMIGGKAVKDFSGRGNSIMPGQRRRFTFEWPRAVTADEVKFAN